MNVLFADGRLRVADAATHGRGPQLVITPTSASGSPPTLDSSEVRDLRDVLTDWLEQIGRSA